MYMEEDVDELNRADGFISSSALERAERAKIAAAEAAAIAEAAALEAAEPVFPDIGQGVVGVRGPASLRFAEQLSPSEYEEMVRADLMPNR